MATYTYDNLSRLDYATLGNGTTADPSYSADSQVSDIIHTATGGNVTFTYNHDTSGLITNLTVSDDLFAPFTDIAGYKTFTVNSLNQYITAMGEALIYDGNGNLSNNGTNDYVHDAVNRLVTATVGSTTWTYAYGPLDRRVSKADGTNTIQYLYDNDRAVAEYNGTGTLLRKYIYGPGLDEPIMMIVPGDPNEIVYYYHADGQGTIIGLTNDSGAWVEKYAYTLYGKPAAASTIGNPYMYTGRRLDPETGLYYYRARYYDPHLRRFIETDPIGYAGGMNLYTYVGNSPVNFIDPLGLLDAKASWAYWDNVGVNGAQRAVNGGALDKITGYGQAAGAAVMCGFIDFFGARKIQENAEKAGYYSAVDGCKWEAVKLGSLVVGQIALESGVAGYVIGKAARPLVKSVNSKYIRFSQRSVNGADEIAGSMRTQGWKGDPIDVVRMPDGKLTTLDNTRVLAADRAGINVQARIHNYDDALPSNFVDRFTTNRGGAPSTFGDAVTNRIGNQGAAYRNTYPSGSYITGVR